MAVSTPKICCPNDFKEGELAYRSGNLGAKIGLFLITKIIYTLIAITKSLIKLSLP